MRQGQLEFARLWVFKAEEDLLVVRQLMQSEMPVKSAIGFHCQQAAEKFLKAFLAFHQQEIIRTHNIEFLLKECSQLDARFNEIDPGNLTDFGVEVRYPGDFLEPSFKEIDLMRRIVGEIRDIVISSLAPKFG